MHFILKCSSLEYRRNKDLIEAMKGEDDTETLGNLLFKTKDENLEELKDMLQRMWMTRKYKILNAQRQLQIQGKARVD